MFKDKYVFEMVCVVSISISSMLRLLAAHASNNVLMRASSAPILTAPYFVKVVLVLKGVRTCVHEPGGKGAQSLISRPHDHRCFPG